VTGGVIRGENARFQLFGDTVNTAARMESTGEPGRIQMSQDTADLLVHGGKEAWFTERPGGVIAKGKGKLQTYWLNFQDTSDGTRSTNDMSSSGGSYRGDEADLEGLDEEERAALVQSCERTARLVDWNCELLGLLLKQIVAKRRALDDNRNSRSVTHRESQLPHSREGCTIDEVKEIISLPEFNDKAAKAMQDARSIELDEKVMYQLHSYVQSIAAMYRNNAFHSFEHASHVTMSVNKLLSRIVRPLERSGEGGGDKSRHDHTYGITSDPLTHFACVLSALIHDVDHEGVPNAQLVKEGSTIAEFYKNKSVAEQNSVDLAWHLLMHSTYDDLRATIYASEAEMRRFRALVVNSVMATDIVDKDLKALRNQRWDAAFSEVADESDGSKAATDRKATIVIEHLIQASDVAHTMQHWHIYRKWNERFFHECYDAYRNGRAEKNPADGWYQGEIGFFDFYIIPLAKKLKDCGVFGVSSDEYLNYAMRNREEWEAKGREVVSEMVEKAETREASNKNAIRRVRDHYLFEL